MQFHATMLERAIGRTLAGWRRDRGMSLAETSSRAGFSSAKLSMMENAIQPSVPIDIMALGYTCRVPTPEWQAPSHLAQQAAQQRVPAPSDHVATFDAESDFARAHAGVVQLRVFQVDVVPTILQTHGYALAAMKADDPLRGAVNAEQRAIVNNAWRRRLYEKEPLVVEVVLHEAAIRQVVGGPKTMNAQLVHLVDLSELPNIRIQVIRSDAGAYPAMGSPFAMMSFAHRQHRDVVYVENRFRSEYLEDQHHCERSAERFGDLQRVALSPPESADLIAEAASRCLVDDASLDRLNLTHAS